MQKLISSSSLEEVKAMETPHAHHLWVDEKQSDVLDPSLVNDHPALSMLKAEKEKLLTDDINQGVNLLSVAEMDYMEKIKEFHERLDMVKKIVKPGCSHEVLNIALCSLSSLARILSQMPQKLHASL
ncbi:uncharacterized protein LOC111879989 [Lactuca sativa]|uniref:Uncharacterized protein n=1 Tax=Lactuca sativa TaxID=4236 RepID=A0A9R1W000_LACSA|nr:uncharacterized protein LOC111879989 [Lactuca sativa]KAJ0214664.1 hypothetical protein LSAT_V11C400173790 [Lactuca sativa]